MFWSSCSRTWKMYMRKLPHVLTSYFLWAKHFKCCILSYFESLQWQEQDLREFWHILGQGKFQKLSKFIVFHTSNFTLFFPFFPSCIIFYPAKCSRGSNFLFWSKQLAVMGPVLPVLIFTVVLQLPADPWHLAQFSDKTNLNNCPCSL